MCFRLTSISMEELAPLMDKTDSIQPLASCPWPHARPDDYPSWFVRIEDKRPPQNQEDPKECAALDGIQQWRRSGNHPESTVAANCSSPSGSASFLGAASREIRGIEVVEKGKEKEAQ